MEIKGLDGCFRCPDCNQIPEPHQVQDYDKKDAWELRCARHGHVSMGSTVEQAVKHWNIYVEFVQKSREAKAS